MYFYRIDRINLSRAVSKNSHYVSGRTLDVGAGPHRRYSFDKVTEYVRMDLEGVPNIDLIGKAEMIPSPNESFDSVVCTQTLADIFNPATAFKEIARVLKPGGHLLLTTVFIGDRTASETQYWHPSDKALRRLSLESGLEPIVLEGCGSYHSVIFRLRTGYLIERYRLNERWFSRALSFILRMLGSIAIYRDSRLPAETKRQFADNWILVAKKHI